MGKTSRNAAPQVQAEAEAAKASDRTTHGRKRRGAGRAAVAGASEAAAPRHDGGAAPPASPSARPTRQNALIALLAREDGASIAEMVEALGWLPHAARAALTGLRKKGYAIERVAVAEGRAARHRIADAPGEAAPRTPPTQPMLVVKTEGKAASPVEPKVAR